MYSEEIETSIFPRVEQGCYTPTLIGTFFELKNTKQAQLSKVISVYIVEEFGTLGWQLLLVRLLWSIDDKWLYASRARLYDNIGTL